MPMLKADRRTMLRSMGILGATLFVPGCMREQAALAPVRFFERIGQPLGLQLYALGEEAGSDLGATFEAVRSMGYGEVELPNLYGRDPAEIRAMADAAGLPIASLHVPAVPFAPGDGLTFQAEPDEVARVADALGITYLVIPFPVLPKGFAVGEGESFPQAISRAFASQGLDHWQATAQRFNEIGEAMKDRGIAVAYHNHNLEFAPLGETTPWEVLLTQTNPELLGVQLDIGWVAQAGLDPVVQLEALGPRVTSLHLKDVATDGAQSFYFGATPTEVGSGRVDWPRILVAAEAAGVAHYFVEQEPPFSVPRYEAMAKSANYLLALET